MSMTAAEPRRADIGGASLVPVAFADLPGWADDDHAAAFAPFRTSCAASLRRIRPCARPRRPSRPAWRPAAARRAGRRRLAARSFFETRFAPFEVRAALRAGFPHRLLRARISRSHGSPATASSVPLLDRPDDLVTISQGETLPGLDPVFRRPPAPGRRLRALSGPRRHRGRRPRRARQARRLSARAGRSLHHPCPGLGAHPPAGRRA